MMRLDVYRYHDDGDSTLGLLLVNGQFDCYTLEDEARRVKVKGETRIPAGRYAIQYRDIGGMVGRYQARFDWHKGMLHLQDVSGFRYVYLHVGNTDEDTDGCLLVGKTAHSWGTISDSVVAYEGLYKPISTALDNGEAVTITIHDAQWIG